mmetsp:Transcript_6986/g.21400  ORF Transcript_6986/g.21400 Transcript_6986/m.21400 type:complete len:128 (-) Transcript_6986:1504-1887(-)
MPLYEIVCLAKPALARPHLARMMQRVGDLVMSDGGIVADVVSYGEQHLAYDIRKPFEKYDKAHIWQMNFMSRPETLKKVDEELKLNEQALRWLVTRQRATLAADDPMADHSAKVAAAPPPAASERAI